MILLDPVKRLIVICLCVGIVIGQVPMDRVREVFYNYQVETDNSHVRVLIQVSLYLTIEIVAVGHFIGQFVVPFNYTISLILLIFGIFGMEAIRGCVLIYLVAKRIWKRIRR